MLYSVNELRLKIYVIVFENRSAEIMTTSWDGWNIL